MDVQQEDLSKMSTQGKKLRREKCNVNQTRRQSTKQIKILNFKKLLALMKAVKEDKKKNSMWSWSNRVGIGWAWRQKCEIAGGGKALFIKAYSVKWHFFPSN